LAMGPMLAAGRNIVYSGARGQVTVRNGYVRMPMHLAEADGLDFKLIKPI
jgi:urea transport system substrate-binding protein